MLTKTKPPVHSARNNPALPAGPVVLVPLANLTSWSGNPRQSFDEESLNELADSIKEIGLLQPLTVRPNTCPEEVEEGFCYQVIAGGRRLRACRLVGLDPVPCSVVEVDEVGALTVAITENDQRSDVDPIERARSYRRLMELGKINQTEIATKLNRSQPWVSQYLALLDFPVFVQEMVQSGDLTLAHVKALRRFLPYPELVSYLARKAHEKEATSRFLETELVPFLDDCSREGLVNPMYYWGGGDRKMFEECRSCPFDAFRSKDVGNSGVCLFPVHHKELQEAVVKAEQERVEKARDEARQRAERLIQQAATKGASQAAHVEGNPEEHDVASEPVPDLASTLVQSKDLPIDSYVALYGTPPNGCTEACSCRSQCLSPIGNVQNICLDPKRQSKLKGDQTRLETKVKKKRFDEIRTQILDLPAHYEERRALAVLLLPQIAGVPADTRRKYAARCADPKFRNLCERSGYFNGKDERAFAALLEMDPLHILSQTLKLTLFHKMQQAWEYHHDLPEEVELMLGIGAAASKLAAHTRESVKTEGRGIALSIVEADDSPAQDTEDECEEDADIDVACERCERVIPMHYLGQPRAAETRFLEDDLHRERTLLRLEGGVLVVNLLAEGDLRYYCAQCAPGVTWCRVCGCTDELGCKSGCEWVEADLCSQCAPNGQ